MLTSAPLLWRTFAFLAIFIMLSGSLGPRIISGGLMYKEHFDIYGGGGKALLFGVIAFALLKQHSKQVAVPLTPWRRTNLVWLALAAISFTYAWVGVTHLLHGTGHSYWPVVTHASLLASVVFAAGGCFGPATLRSIARTYKRELLLAIAISVIFFGFLQLVYGLWKPLAGTVLHAVRGLLALTGLHAVILPPRTLLLDKFGIDIAQACSGIESIALFAGLYAIIGLLDWQRFNHRRYLTLFPVGLVALFGFNILRVYGLIVAGYFINQHIAFTLFHTYAGMVFFIIYSGVFWRVAYGWMLRAGKTT